MDGVEEKLNRFTPRFGIIQSTSSNVNWNAIIEVEEVLRVNSF